MFLGKKDPKKDNNPKCKVNTLTRYMSFGPRKVVVGKYHGKKIHIFGCI
jgi:hypothetical protein